MSNITRSAKSADDWSECELMAYNIIVHRQSSVEFFGFKPSSSLDYIDPHIINDSLDAISDSISDQSYRLLWYLGLANRPSHMQESAIDDFTRELLRVIGFEERGTILCSRCAIPFNICDDYSRLAENDIFLLDKYSTILLVIQKNMVAVNSMNSEPQTIASAIAAFQHNNVLRRRNGLKQLEAMTIPCIGMLGTKPAFYKVHVTRALSGAVATGQYPPEPTHVHKCVVAPVFGSWSGGMKDPEFRKMVLQHFDAFKTLAKSLWSVFISR